MRDARLWEIFGFVVLLVGFLRFSAGRLSPKVIVAPIVFLITRTAVLIAWALGALAMFGMIVVSARGNGHDPFADPLFLVGISLFCGLGVAVLTLGPGFMLYRLRATPPEVALEPGEHVEEEIVANHFLRGEARGGKLLLTDRRVAFRPHRFNVQLDTWSARYADIRSVATSGARFVDLSLTDGSEAWLVVMRPADVAAKLQPHLAVAA